MSESTTSNTEPKVNENKDTIYFINAIPTTEKPELVALFSDRQKELKLSSAFWSEKATNAADEETKKKTLPPLTDERSIICRSNYRVRIFEYVIQNSAWIASHDSQTCSKRFSPKDGMLHGEILKAVLSGLAIPESTYSDFESILKSICDDIAKSKIESVEKHKLVLLVIYRYDPMQEQVWCSLRTILFSVSEKMMDFVRSKNGEGRDKEFELIYKRNDSTFNAKVWDAMKDHLRQFIKDEGAGIEFINLSIPGEE